MGGSAVDASSCVLVLPVCLASALSALVRGRLDWLEDFSSLLAEGLLAEPSPFGGELRPLFFRAMKAEEAYDYGSFHRCENPDCVGL